MPIRVYKLCRSHRKMNIWSDSCAWSSYRCVVFIQPPPQHQQHLHPARSPPQELGLSQARCMFALPPSNASISFCHHLSLEEWRRFLSEPLIPARCCRGNAWRSGSWAEAGSLDPSLHPLPSSHHAEQLQWKAV